MSKRAGPDFFQAQETTRRIRIGGRERPFTWQVFNIILKFEKDAAGFLFSDPNIQYDEAANNKWDLIRPLGNGSWGSVALWTKTPSDGNMGSPDLHDYCAIKEVLYSENFQYPDLPCGFVSEVVVSIPSKQG